MGTDEELGFIYSLLESYQFSFCLWGSFLHLQRGFSSSAMHDFSRGDDYSRKFLISDMIYNIFRVFTFDVLPIWIVLILVCTV